MPLETAQMLSTAVLINGGDSKYKISHKNHPCSIWARDTRENFVWLCKLGLKLCEEHLYRYDKDKYHASHEVIIGCYNQSHLIPDGDFYNPPQCMPEQYKRSNVVDAYREYYINDKSNIANWKKRQRPNWFQ
jgi:hypothetical protein